jgi:uncharacterized SAM-binding protein YcdF (DUF218 family)
MRTGTTQPREKPRSVVPSPERGREALWGAALGVLLWVAGLQLGIGAAPGLSVPPMVALAAIAGGILGLTRARWLLRATGAVLAAGLLAVAYLIPVPEMARAWARVDGPLRPDQGSPLPAAVVLSAAVRSDGTPGDRAQLRLLRAYELLGAGAARRLVITRVAPPVPSTLAAVRGQMAHLGLSAPVEEVGPARNTHDEALAVAALARRRGWKAILLVSDPIHLRRAAAVFAAAGLTPLCAPSQPYGYDLISPASPASRWSLFREWLREYGGYQVYRWRGWIHEPAGYRR